MLKNYIKITLRNLLKNFTFSSINIMGLSAGIASVIIIILFVNYELSYDKIGEDYNKVYRIAVEQAAPNNKLQITLTSGPFGPAFQNDFPEIKSFVRFRVIYRGKPVFKYEDKKFYESGLYAADSGFFDVFGYKLVSGNPKKALTEPFSIVLTQEMSEKYFGNENPIGKIININGTDDYKVTGVLQNIPSNTHFKFDFLASFTSLNFMEGKRLDNWFAFALRTYVKVTDSFDRDKFEKKLPAFLDKYMGEKSREWGLQYSVIMQPLVDIHLYSKLLYEFEANGDITMVYGLLGIAFLILLIACINFINLSTARSLKRAKEIGLRKVIGANRFQLIRQLLSESIVIAITALLIAAVLVVLLVPYIEVFFPAKNLSVGSINVWMLVALLLGIVVIVGIVSGSYPAFYLSKFDAAEVLKGGSSSGTKKEVFRKLLVIAQFSISVAMIILTAVIYSQLKYMKNRDPGFNKDRVLVLHCSKELLPKFETIKNVLLENSQIKSASFTSNIPGELLPQSSYMPEGTKGDDKISLPTYFADYDFLKTLEIDVIEGRNFSKEFGTDAEEGFIINQSMLKHLGWDNALEKYFEWTIRPGKKGKVVGVVKDFNYYSLHQPVGPVVIHIFNDQVRFMLVKISGENVKQTIASIEEKWSELAPEIPFEYTFLNEGIDRLYESDERLSNIAIYFAILSIVISCMGLFGLAAFTVEQKVREIGLRKILGSSTNGILGILIKDIFKLIILANIIAWPISYFAANEWLSDFAYKINVELWIFILSSLGTLVIAVTTISYQVIRAANSNPVDTLRHQ